eukprot:5845351-Prorocentrum_lima.AAC.1
MPTPTDACSEKASFGMEVAVTVELRDHALNSDAQGNQRAEEACNRHRDPARTSRMTPCTM